MIEKTFPITEHLLINGLTASQKLLDLLQSEAENLARRTEPQALINIAAAKKDVVLQLEQFATQLGQVLATEQLLADHNGINRYLQKAQTAGMETSDCKSNWANITALSKKCRLLNEQNGACIDLLSRHTARALQILKGKAVTANTYGPDGATRGELFSYGVISV